MTSVSFEFFPPKTEEQDAALWKAIGELEKLKPSFVSVTYGAGGTTRERTLGTVARIVKDTKLKPAAHLTCVAASKDEINDVVRGYHAAGVRHIVALRGDPQGGIGTRFVPHPQGYQNAADLVRGIREIADFEVSVSAYPEKHPESVSIEEDLAFMADKAAHGATRAITQFFFNNDFYFHLQDRIAARGIKIDLVPGIMPVMNFARAQDFAHRCGASVPHEMVKRFASVDDNPALRQKVAEEFAAEQVESLRRAGVSHFHFYSLNRAEMCRNICLMTGLA